MVPPVVHRAVSVRRRAGGARPALVPEREQPSRAVGVAEVGVVDVAAPVDDADDDAGTRECCARRAPAVDRRPGGAGGRATLGAERAWCLETDDVRGVPGREDRRPRDPARRHTPEPGDDPHVGGIGIAAVEAHDGLDLLARRSGLRPEQLEQRRVHLSCPVDQAALADPACWARALTLSTVRRTTSSTATVMTATPGP